MSAIVGAAALVLAGCSGTGGSGSTDTSGSGSGDEIQSGTSVSVAENAGLTTLNPNTATGYATYNSNVAYMFTSGWNYYDATPKLVKNTKFGTYEKTGDNPLTIKYTINPNVKWSNGVPVNAADMLLAWATSQSKYNAKGKVNFQSIGAGTGLALASKVPAISNNNHTITVVYDKPYVDWEITSPTPTISADTLWGVSGAGKETGAKAQAAMIKAIQNNDTAALSKVASTWATKYNINSMPTDKRLLVADGPYTVTNYVKDQYVTLSARKDYIAGPKPHIQKITVRFIPDQTAQVQALSNGELKVLYGQATADTVKALKQVKGVTSTTSPEASYEHIDLSFNNGGPFSAKGNGGDAKKALLVRQAFLKVVPRQEMLDRLIKPLSPTAKLDESQLFLPGQPGYDDAAKASNYARYDKVDVAGAKALLKQAGISTPVTVKFAYATDNPRRVGEFQLLQASAKQAGFKVTDVGKPGAQFFDPSTGVGTGKYNYDACVFAYVNSAISATQSQANTTSGNAYNYNGYSNKNVDSLWKQIESSTSFNAAIPGLQKVDKFIINDASSISLYQLPDVSAWATNLENVKDAPLTPNIYWNFFDWQVKGAK
jgi:peptide/nickel transport system substrate-binding protein